MNKKNIVWLSLILIVLISGCHVFSPSNIETVVKENRIIYWYLSPNGDYIVYGSPRGDFLLNLATRQEHEFDCELLWWNSYHFGCHKSREISVIDAKTLIEISLNPIDLGKRTTTSKPEIDIDSVLAKAEMIYRPEWTTDTVYILTPNYQLNPEKNYVISGLTQSDQLLTKYTVVTITVPFSKDRYPEKTFSPDGLYYYDSTSNGFAIFTIDNNKIVAEFVRELDEELEMGGWEFDSSGVYFRTYSVGVGRIGLPKEIRKLKVPDE